MLAAMLITLSTLGLLFMYDYRQVIGYRLILINILVIVDVAVTVLLSTFGVIIVVTDNQNNWKKYFTALRMSIFAQFILTLVVLGLGITAQTTVYYTMVQSYTKYFEDETIHTTIDHIQLKLRCCGATGVWNFKFPSGSTNESLPGSCCGTRVYKFCTTDNYYFTKEICYEMIFGNQRILLKLIYIIIINYLVIKLVNCYQFYLVPRRI